MSPYKDCMREVIDNFVNDDSMYCDEVSHSRSQQGLHE